MTPGQTRNPTTTSNRPISDITANVEHEKPGKRVIRRLIFLRELSTFSRKTYLRSVRWIVASGKGWTMGPTVLPINHPGMIRRLLEASTSGSNASKSEWSPRISTCSTWFTYYVSCLCLNSRKTRIVYTMEPPCSWCNVLWSSGNSSRVWNGCHRSCFKHVNCPPV